MSPIDYRNEQDWDRPEYPEAKTVWYCPNCGEPRTEDETDSDDRCNYCGTEVEERDDD